MLDLRPVGYVIGLLTSTLGALMLLPMCFDLASGLGNWRAFASSAAIAFFVGLFLTLACANAISKGLNLRQSFILTTGVWVVLPVFGAVPFLIGAPQLSFTDALFEAMSGLTTTGTTVITGLDQLPPGVNLWRAMLNWLGGLGIVIVALLFLPVMKVGGMQFFRTEGFDTLGKVLPRALDISSALLQVYVVMTALCALAYRAAGMSAYESLIHALSVISTGGFSNRDSSFANFSPTLHYISVVAMLLSTLPFIRFIQLAQGQITPLWQDLQVRAYLRWTGYAIALVLAWRVFKGGEPFTATLHDSIFNVVSTFSGTGFTSGDPSAWGPLPFMVLLIAGFIGGCTASTGCSVKVFRYLILFRAIRTQLRRIVHPYGVHVLRLQGRKVEGDVINSVIVFFTLFVATFGVLAILLSMTGLQPRTALTAAWTSIANIGPVWGPEVGPTGAVGRFPDAAKWIMAAGMLLGRLEILSVFVLFTRRFWAR